jgi:hypothetical protein
MSKSKLIIDKIYFRWHQFIKLDLGHLFRYGLPQGEGTSANPTASGWGIEKR